MKSRILSEDLSCPSPGGAAAHAGQEASTPSHGNNAEKPWLRFYDAGVPATLNYREAPLYAWLDEAAEKSPSAVACSYHNSDISYARMRKDAERIAANLAAHGVQPGDRVGIMLPNLPQTLQAFWGVLKAGAVVTMFNPLYMEKELLHQVNDAGLKHMITIDQCWPKFEKLQESLCIEKYFVTTIADGLSFPSSFLQRFRNRRDRSAKAVPYDNKTVYAFASLLKGGQRLSVPIENPREALALLQYTGGTTGLSKGAMLTHYNVASNAQQIQASLCNLEYGKETFVAVLPLFHVYGLTTCLVVPTLFGARVVPVTRYAPAELLKTMTKLKASVLPGAPAMYISLLQQKNTESRKLDTLKVCIAGSAPMPTEMQRQFEERFGARIMEGYGLSEASPITHLTPTTGIRKVGSIGLPLPDTEARIVDMELGTVPLAAGKVGELIIRGPQVMPGYWNKPDETAGTLRNGWLYTGDIATMDEDGFFYIVDRKKDMIIVGGYNVAPRDIDEVLYEHPKVREAVTVGVPHPTRGEVIKVYVVLKEGEHCNRTEIVSWCRERLANYKVPRMVEFRDELPKTLVGKILRRVLRAEEEARQKQSARDGERPDLESEPYFENEPCDKNEAARKEAEKRKDTNPPETGDDSSKEVLSGDN